MFYCFFIINEHYWKVHETSYCTGKSYVESPWPIGLQARNEICHRYRKSSNVRYVMKISQSRKCSNAVTRSVRNVCKSCTTPAGSRAILLVQHAEQRHLFRRMTSPGCGPTLGRMRWETRSEVLHNVTDRMRMCATNANNAKRSSLRPGAAARVIRNTANLVSKNITEPRFSVVTQSAEYFHRRIRLWHVERVRCVWSSYISYWVGNENCTIWYRVDYTYCIRIWLYWCRCNCLIYRQSNNAIWWNLVSLMFNLI